MGRDDELRVRKARLQEAAELLAVALVDGHDNVVQDGKPEPVAEHALHQREIQAHAHPVLVAFAVVGGGRKHALVVERHFQIELALRRIELRLEGALVVGVDVAVEV